VSKQETSREDVKTMQDHTKTAKTTKKLRKAIIMQNILTGTFDRPKLIEQFHCSDRAFRTDMNELAEDLEQPIENQVTMLRAICAEKLSALAAQNNLEPVIMAKILVAGFAKKLEVKEEITERQIKIVRMWQPNANLTETERSNP